MTPTANSSGDHGNSKLSEPKGELQWEDLKRARNRINSQRTRERERVQMENLDAQKTRLLLSNEALRYQNQHYRQAIKMARELLAAPAPTPASHKPTNSNARPVLSPLLQSVPPLQAGNFPSHYHPSILALLRNASSSSASVSNNANGAPPLQAQAQVQAQVQPQVQVQAQSQPAPVNTTVNAERPAYNTISLSNAPLQQFSMLHPAASAISMLLNQCLAQQAPAPAPVAPVAPSIDPNQALAMDLVAQLRQSLAANVNANGHATTNGSAATVHPRDESRADVAADASQTHDRKRQKN